MKREEMKKKVANKVVGAAVQMAAMPNQECYFILGKPKNKLDLTLDDYADLKAHLKNTK